MDWASMIGQLAGVAVGTAMSQMDKNEAMGLIKSVSDEFGRINVPALQQLVLEKQGPSQLAGIHDDPAYRAQQAAADAQLNDIISSGGLTLADKASLNAIRNKLSRSESAGRNAIEGGMAARGSLDSGAQLAMQLQGNQQTANAAAEEGARTAGMAQNRAFEAIRERARNAGQGLDRSFAQEARKASAQDAINAGNTAIANTANKYNAGIPQQNFANQMALTNAKAGPTYALAGAKAGQAKDTQQTWQGVGNVAGQAGNTYAQQKAAEPTTASHDYGTAAGASDEYPSNALSGETTKPQRQVIGHRIDGSPIYGDELR